MKHLSHTHCLIAVALAIVAIVAFGLTGSSLLYAGMFLACPLIMFFMMRAMMSNNPPAAQEPDQSVSAGQRASHATK